MGGREGVSAADWPGMAEHLGAAYLRYSFTRSTVAEVDALVEVLGLEPGMRVLDVGCGPGRHVHELARRGIMAHGIDLSPAFVELATVDAPSGATFEVADALRLASDPRHLGRFDAVISWCQGAFGSIPVDNSHPGGTDGGDPQHLGPDLAVLDGIRAALRPGGRCAVTAFHSAFQLRWLEDTDRYDPATGENLERTEIRDPAGRSRSVELSTTCYSARELRLLGERAGLRVDAIGSADPASRFARTPGLDDPQLIMLARRANQVGQVGDPARLK